MADTHHSAVDAFLSMNPRILLTPVITIPELLSKVVDRRNEKRRRILSCSQLKLTRDPVVTTGERTRHPMLRIIEDGSVSKGNGLLTDLDELARSVNSPFPKFRSVVIVPPVSLHQ